MSERRQLETNPGRQGWGTCGLRPAGQKPPAKTFKACIIILATQVRAQHRVKTKLHEKQTRRQQVKKSLSRSLKQFSLLVFLWGMK